MSLLEEKKYTPAEAAAKLGISRSTFDGLVKGNKIAVIKHNERRVEVPESSLEKYLQACLKKSALKKPSKKGGR